MDVVYDPRCLPRLHFSASPTMRKVKALAARWRELFPDLEWLPAEPSSAEELARAHHPDYVDAVLSGRAPNGLGAMDTDWLLWQTGILASAAVRAWETRGCVTALTTGFHHAGHRSAWGFCTFNADIVAAQRLLARGVRRVAILDLDHHKADGTIDIIGTLGLADRIDLYSFGAMGVTPDRADAWLRGLPGIVSRLKARGAELLIYDAGADAHIDDPLGGELTTAQMARRDALVFTACRDLGLPMCWFLGGGYQEPPERTLALHDATLRAARAAWDGGGTYPQA